MPRIHCPLPLHAGAAISLPPGAARHVQVLRLQPGHGLTLFDGTGGEWSATVARMGRSEVHVEVGEHTQVEREAVRPVHVMTGLMASERMDWLVEKATELGAASVWPVLTERSSLRLSGERAEKKRTHWQAVAVAACEQCGRNRVPAITQPTSLATALTEFTPPTQPQPQPLRAVLSLAADAAPLARALAPYPADAPLWLLSGPEGGLTPAEEAAARTAGFVPVSLGPRILRAETAPLAALAWAGAVC